MRNAFGSLTVALVIAACSGGSGYTQADCDRIAEKIRAEAPRKGFNASGVCSNAAALRDVDIKTDCGDLVSCNDAVAR